MAQEEVIIKNNNNDDWSKDYLIGRLKKHLAIVEIGPDDYINNLGDKTNWDYLESRKYYNRAHHYLKIGAFSDRSVSIFFVVNLSDLTKRLIQELCQLVDERDRRLVLKQSVARIFEDINFELYHDSISKVLKVELRP
jgi:hypothetical protein